jgi:DNA-binding transcriptional regulator YhcF (GntR family)
VWLSRETGIPIHEQLGAQIILGIVSRRLKPDERLPSVRALARQLKLHPNTISAVYRSLVERGWLKRKMGSGVYVSLLQLPAFDKDIDAFARACLEEGRARGFSPDALREAFGQAIARSTQRQFVMVNPDAELARILAAELGEVTGQEVGVATDLGGVPRGSCILITHAGSRALNIPSTLDHRIVRLKSMQDLLLGIERPRGPALVAVVSSSASVRNWAATLLSALGFSSDMVLLRDPAQPGWHEGLGACHIVAADVLNAAEVANYTRAVPITFRLVATDFCSELQLVPRSSEICQDM